MAIRVEEQRVIDVYGAEYGHVNIMFTSALSQSDVEAERTGGEFFNLQLGPVCLHLSARAMRDLRTVITEALDDPRLP